MPPGTPRAPGGDRLFSPMPGIGRWLGPDASRSCQPDEPEAATVILVAVNDPLGPG